MVVAGAERDDIVQRLRADFGVEDAEAMLDAILAE
jgi:hypothetical protein